MAVDQFVPVKELFDTGEYDDLKHSVFQTFLADPENAAKMIISFAQDKNIVFEKTTDEVVKYMSGMIDDDDFELTPEMLSMIAGGYHSGHCPQSGNT